VLQNSSITTKVYFVKKEKRTTVDITKRKGEK